MRSRVPASTTCNKIEIRRGDVTCLKGDGGSALPCIEKCIRMYAGVWYLSAVMVVTVVVVVVVVITVVIVIAVVLVVVVVVVVVMIVAVVVKWNWLEK